MVLPFFEFVAVVVLGGVVLVALLSWISKTRPAWRNMTGFLFALGAAYAGSFALDLFIGASLGVYPFRPFTVPVFTWSGMAIVLHGCAQFVSSSRRWVSVPYFIVGGIATMTGMLGSHRYSILVGAPLMLFGWFPSHSAARLRPRAEAFSHAQVFRSGSTSLMTR